MDKQKTPRTKKPIKTMGTKPPEAGNKKAETQPTSTNPEKTPQEEQQKAMEIIFFDPDEEQIKESYSNEAKHGRGPPEFNPQDNTYTYAIDKDERGEPKAQFYYMLKIKPDHNENEILQYHEREEE